MIFGKDDRILDIGYKETEITEFNEENINLILKSLFDGKYNMEEIRGCLAEIEQSEIDVKELFDKNDLKGWYFQDLDDRHKMMTSHIIMILGLHISFELETITIKHSERGKSMTYSDISKDMKAITDDVRGMIEDFNNKKDE